MREAARRQLLLEPPEIALEHRLDRGVDRSRHAALVFAILGKDHVAGGDVAVRPQLGGDRQRTALVDRIAVAVQEMDHQGFAAHRQQPDHRRAQRLLVERRQDPAIGGDPLRHLEAALARDQGLEAAEQAVSMRSGAPAELEDVAKAARRDQPGARDLALEQGVGGGRGAVDDGRDRGQIGVGRRERLQHAQGLVVGSRRHLGDPHLAIPPDQHQIGEGAADVDADQAALHRCRQADLPERCPVRCCDTRAIKHLGRAWGSPPCGLEHRRRSEDARGGGRQNVARTARVPHEIKLGHCLFMLTSRSWLIRVGLHTRAFDAVESNKHP